jgi:hypothetical protein
MTTTPLVVAPTQIAPDHMRSPALQKLVDPRHGFAGGRTSNSTNSGFPDETPWPSAPPPSYATRSTCPRVPARGAPR